MPTPEVRKGIPGVVKGAIAAGVLATAGLGAAVGLGAFNRGEPRQDVTPTPSAAAASPTPEKTPVPTATPTGKVEVTVSPSPKSSPTPEVKKDVPCQILPIEYCSQAEVVIWQVSGKSYTFIGFNFPEGVRVPVFAAVGGHLLLSKENSQPFLGSDANIRTANGENYDIKGNIDTSKFGNLLDIPVKAGDLIGYTQKTDKKNLGSYDIVFTISRAGASGPEVVEDKLKELLPEAFQKMRSTYTSLVDPKTGTGVMYLDQSK